MFDPSGRWPQSSQPALRDVDALHKRCGIYTKPKVVRAILDAVGWQSRRDLTQARLLEPAAGDGAFVAEAGKRLVRSFEARGIALSSGALAPVIRSFELHPTEAERARVHVVRALRSCGVHHVTAQACARAWVSHGDFLLSPLANEAFTHAVGNPPYIRWSKIPKGLRTRYEEELSPGIAGGDLFLPFLDRALASLVIGGKCGFICSDRWRYMAFAEDFRQKWMKNLNITSETRVKAIDAFQTYVDAYPTILVATKRVDAKRTRARPPSDKRTLIELGCEIKVGPALGHSPAFILEKGEDRVEPWLLRPWIEQRDIGNLRVKASGRKVITMHLANGELRAATRYRKLYQRLLRHKKALTKRYVVKNGAKWYAPINRVRAVDWLRPKLLIPEMTKVPRVAIDRSGSIPSHGVYAIFCGDDNVDAIYRRLRGGRLAMALKAIAPRVNSGYVRCYKRFLEMIRV